MLKFLDIKIWTLPKLTSRLRFRIGFGNELTKPNHWMFLITLLLRSDRSQPPSHHFPGSSLGGVQCPQREVRGRSWFDSDRGLCDHRLPVRMHETGIGPIGALIRMGTEKIALGLSEILRQHSAAIAVEIRERG